MVAVDALVNDSDALEFITLSLLTRQRGYELLADTYLDIAFLTYYVNRLYEEEIVKGIN